MSVITQDVLSHIFGFLPGHPIDVTDWPRKVVGRAYPAFQDQSLPPALPVARVNTRWNSAIESLYLDMFNHIERQNPSWFPRFTHFMALKTGKNPSKWQTADKLMCIHMLFKRAIDLGNAPSTTLRLEDLGKTLLAAYRDGGHDRHRLEIDLALGQMYRWADINGLPHATAYDDKELTSLVTHSNRSNDGLTRTADELRQTPDIFSQITTLRNHTYSQPLPRFPLRPSLWPLETQLCTNLREITLGNANLEIVKKWFEAFPSLRSLTCFMDTCTTEQFTELQQLANAQQAWLNIIVDGNRHILGPHNYHAQINERNRTVGAGDVGSLYRCKVFDYCHNMRASLWSGLCRARDATTQTLQDRVALASLTMDVLFVAMIAHSTLQASSADSRT